MPKDDRGDRPVFSGIADPKCHCTPDRLCRRCNPPPLCENADILRPELTEWEREKSRFRGKFRVPWDEAVRKNNEKGESK